MAFFVGMQPTGIQLVCQTLNQMYRRILGNLPHCTRETHSSVLEKFHIEPPEAALTMVHSQDVIHRINWQTLNSTRTLLTSACIYCAFIAPSLPELQKHHTLVHALPRPLPPGCGQRQDTTDGMPQCKHCKKIFLTWSSFKLHCRANICGAIPIQSTVTHPPPIF